LHLTLQFDLKLGACVGTQTKANTLPMCITCVGVPNIINIFAFCFRKYVFFAFDKTVVDSFSKEEEHIIEKNAKDIPILMQQVHNRTINNKCLYFWAGVKISSYSRLCILTSQDSTGCVKKASVPFFNLGGFIYDSKNIVQL
jgi:hypothetical protein